MPGETCVLPENKFTIIADVPATRQSRLRFGTKISSITGEQTEIPDLIWPISDATADRRLLKANRCHVPRLRPRREGCVFHFRGVIKLTETAGDGEAACVVRSPNHRTESVLVASEPIDEVQGRSGGALVANRGDIFVNQRRTDE